MPLPTIRSSAFATPRPRSPQYAPFIDDGDDFLSQICQMQIFFSLLSTIILQTDPNSPVMAVALRMHMMHVHVCVHDRVAHSSWWICTAPKS